MQSNLAIAEKLMRISDYLELARPRYPNEACALSIAPAVLESLTIAERAVARSSTDLRLWHGQSAYSPEVLVKDRKTPAMCLGLAKGPTGFAAH